MSDQNILVGKGPLMYIVQPDLDVGTGRMQKSFITRKNNKVVQIDHDGKQLFEQANSKKSEVEKEKNVNQEKVEAIITNSSKEVEKKNDVVTGVRKPFKDMTIEEKINYLVNRPVYIPKIPCEVKTNNEAFVGYVESYKNDVLTLVSNSDLNGFRAKTSDIISIRLLGI